MDKMTTEFGMVSDVTIDVQVLCVLNLSSLSVTPAIFFLNKIMFWYIVLDV